MRHPTPAELHRLFQARLWREYAMAWDGRKTMTGVGREWVEKVLRGFLRRSHTTDGLGAVSPPPTFKGGNNG